MGEALIEIQKIISISNGKQLLDVSFISTIVFIAINFYRLNREINYIKKVVIKITKKLNIELFDIDLKK